MVDTGIFATSAQIVRKAGLGAALSSGALSISEAATNQYIGEAEGLINVAAGFNFSAEYSNLNNATRLLLQEIASSLAAIPVISFDFKGYDSRLDAEDTINVLRDAALRGLAIIRDKKKSDFIRSDGGIL